MHEVYLGLYSRGASDLPAPARDERLQACSIIEEFADADQGITIAGQGWQRYPELAALNSQWIGGQSEVLYPSAVWLLDLSDLSGAIDPKDIEPAYLRQKVAERPVL